MALKSVHHSVYIVGAPMQVYDLFDMASPAKAWEGVVVKVSPKMISIKHPLGEVYRFHRITGYIVGFSWPGYCWALRPQTA